MTSPNYTEISVEEYYLQYDAKVVRMILTIDNEGKKIPTRCYWFGNKIPSMATTNKSNSLYVFDKGVYDDYLYNKKDKIDSGDFWHSNALGIDTRDIFQLDFDDESDKETIDELIKLGIPYFLSYTKRFHHFVFRDKKFNTRGKKAVDFKSKNFKEYKNNDGKLVKHSGELLCGQWSYAHYNEMMCNIELTFEKGDFIDFDIMGSGLIKLKQKEVLSNTRLLADTTNPAITTPNLLTDINEYAKCIDIEKHFDAEGCYNDWRNIIWGLASEGHYELARELSKKGTKWDESVFDKLYNSYDKTKGINIGTFYHYCKLGNEELFNELGKKYPIDDRPMVFVTEHTEHDDKAKIIFERYGDYFIFMNNYIYFWSDFHKKWFLDDKGYLHTSKFITDKFREWGEAEVKNTPKFIVDEDGKKCISEKWKFLKSVIKKNKQVPEISNVVKAFKYYLNDRNDVIKMDDKPYLLPFRNTVYDFAIKEFREQKKEDYLTMNCGYEWVEPTKEQSDLIKLLIEKIFVNEEIRKCYMSILLNGCIGICPEKFIIANGGGRNGKGVLNDLMRCALGDYGYKGNESTLCEKIKEGANPEVANFHKKRFINFAEPDVNYPINTATMKKLSGGGEINARQLYSGNTDTTLEAIIVVEANQKPNLNGTDSDSIALKERIRDVLFESSFTAKTDDEVDKKQFIFKQNAYYKTTEFQQNHSSALLKYLMEYEDIDEIYTPDCVAQRSQEYLLGNDKIYQFVSENIVAEEGCWVRVSDLYDMFKNDDSYINLNKCDKRKYNLTNFKSTIQKHSQFKRHYKESYQYDKTTARNILIGFTTIELAKKNPEDTK